MVWYPELRLGAVVLCNTELSDDLVVQLNQEILDSIIASASDVYAQRAKSRVQVEPACPPDTKGTVLSDAALQTLIVGKALPEEASTAKQRNRFVGMYLILGLNDTAVIRDQNDTLMISYWGTTETLSEVELGLYFSPYGDAIDFRGRIPTYSNIRLGKVDARTRLLYIAFYAICGLVFLSAVFYPPVRALLRRIHWKRAALGTAIPPSSGLWQIWTTLLAVLASLFSLLWLVLFALLPNMLYIRAYIPLWRPYVDLLWWQFALLSLPFASLLLAAGIILMVLFMRSHAWAHATRWYYIAVGLALLTFNLAIIL